jgi:hypothetical protein
MSSTQHIRSGMVALVVGLATVFPVGSALAAGFHGGGFHGGGFHGGGFHGGGFHGGGFAAGGFHGGGLHAGGFRGGGFHPSFAGSFHGGFHAAPAVHSFTGFTGSRSFVGHVQSPHSFGGALTAPHSFETFTAPHHFGGTVASSHPFVRTTPPFGNLGALAGTERGRIPSVGVSHVRPSIAEHPSFEGEHHEHAFHGREGEEFERHEHGLLGEFGFFPFAYYPYFSSYLYPYDYGYEYPYYSPYYDYYSYPYYTSDSGYSSYPEPSYLYESEAPLTATTSGQYGTTTGEQFYDDALAAFREGDYQTAARMAAHALIDMPREAKVHELMSLSMFALGNYRGAAMEAHAALVLGPVADWPTLYAYYDNLHTYTSQLDALENYVHAHPSSMSARFVLAYHDLMMGHIHAAEGLLSQVVGKVPQDKVAAALLKQLESHGSTIGNIAAVLPPANSSKG